MQEMPHPWKALSIFSPADLAEKESCPSSDKEWEIHGISKGAQVETCERKQNVVTCPFSPSIDLSQATSVLINNLYILDLIDFFYTKEWL